jgi:catechol 2,3-dioxygenase-like lactoylglutathione lyase family enzyme
MQRLSLADYAARLKDLPVPDAAQVDAFVDYVRGMHSWYKHLPLLPPGAAFVFFLDPNAGMDTVHHPDGRVELRWRGEGERHFHYSARPTAVYRAAFGHLAVAQDASPSFELHSGSSVLRLSSEPAIRVDGEPWLLPSDVLALGSVEVSGLIHPMANRVSLWKRYFDEVDLADLRWPEETGGVAALQRLFELTGGDRFRTASDLTIADLLADERARQLAAMRSAAATVVALCMS